MKTGFRYHYRSSKEKYYSVSSTIKYFVKVLEAIKNKQDAALIRAVYTNAQNDFLSVNATNEFLAHLANN